MDGSCLRWQLHGGDMLKTPRGNRWPGTASCSVVQPGKRRIAEAELADAATESRSNSRRLSRSLERRPAQSGWKGSAGGRCPHNHRLAF
jgi:hypothetical protein